MVTRSVYLVLVLQAGLVFTWNSLAGLRCGFEELCAWRYNSSFRVAPASEKPFDNYSSAPRVDGSYSPNGSYLMLLMKSPGPKQMLMWSPKYASTGEQCRLKVMLHMGNMVNGSFKVLVEIVHNKTSWVVSEKNGTDSNQWEEYNVKIGRLRQEFNLVLEVTPSERYPSHVALDNIKLTDCFNVPLPSYLNCSPTQYQCRNGTCIDKLDVCDLTIDCADKDDEQQDCDKVPAFARCTFEDGQCGWKFYSDPDMRDSVDSSSSGSYKNQISWKLQTGPGPNSENSGPNVDHTYQNISGSYMHVNMVEGNMGATAILRSPVINPPPWYHNDSSSSYFNSCYITFYFNKFGTHQSSFALFIQQLDKPKSKITNKKILLWYTFGRKDNTWIRQIVHIPTNITQRYHLMFEARKGIGKWSDVAIDDISMSPKCFGLGVPKTELRGYDYEKAGEIADLPDPQAHEDFENVTIYEFGTCGVNGSEGPTPKDCEEAYNNTNVNVTVLTEKLMNGIQLWVVPETGYYTIIGRGANGGQGSERKGSSWAAEARTIVELVKGQLIYVLVGQSGLNACSKGRERVNHSIECELRKIKQSTKSPLRDKIKAISLMDYIGGGGGGGGATYIFTWQKNKQRVPLLVAAGGGGLALKESNVNNVVVDNSKQDGHGMNTTLQPTTGDAYDNSNPAGAGGGWMRGNYTHRDVTGLALVQGAAGGKACTTYSGAIVAGGGGFGGGGGGCLAGGGGGGFTGGRAGNEKEDDGEGGYSWVDGPFGKVSAGAHPGPGRVFIIPAITGCHCDYLCVTLDYHRQDVQCLCPLGWNLDSDKHSCVLTDDEVEPGIIVILGLTALILVIPFVCLIIFLYNKYQRKKVAVLRSKFINGNGTGAGTDLQLNRLRVGHNDSIMTEYNPNYEFGGGTYRLRDLKDIPRDNLRLVKALGQGAFGEVYQGFYKQRENDAVEMPVAVKTLPELSTSQAETDFLMEALIMNKFTHPNIVHCIGVCFDRHPRYLVIELLAGGDLKSFLREERPKIDKPTCLKMKDLIQIAIDVAKGCKYMEEQRFIHRDIAARNCLLTTKGPGRVVKIADFGMARDIYRSDYYKKGGKAMLPIKWMPPEAFLDGLFTSKTDVWSFGVLLWEVMSLGFMPYAGSTNREVMTMVVAGSRLSPPAQCPGPIYGIMNNCWAVDPALRPNFQLILERLGYCLQDPQVVNTPLPVFDTIPTNEAVKDTEPNMRPPENEGPLQVNGYLVPNGDGRGGGGGVGVGVGIGSMGVGSVGIGSMVGGVNVGIGGMTESQSSQPLLESPSNNNNHKMRIPYANVNPLTATGLYTVSSKVP
ncbi:anaplastic lymphoma kinase isoform X2 [Lycorma delicatula]|uniref:anaplastic lymphoma kinase isoform X2 n=1 Tax=Lycorma delicatula TaxID=130591 RepID=UPI003F519937